MSLPLEDYALIGNCHTAALVSRYGSIDWLCLPSFDSPACFASLLGTRGNGYWQIAPAGEFQTKRRYLKDTLVLENEFITPNGRVRIRDWMVVQNHESDPTDPIQIIHRVVEGLEGDVLMRSECAIRFNYGSILPWINPIADDKFQVIAGPDVMDLWVHGETRVDEHQVNSEFRIRKGQALAFKAKWRKSYAPDIESGISWDESFHSTVKWWTDWASRCRYEGPYRDIVLRSLITLKALIFMPTGGIVAAPTTSLPEEIGGVRNWDYRYSWVRDSTFTLYALLSAGYTEEAEAWSDWLIRAVAGTPDQLHVVYGIRGERRLTELELDWFTGYENSKPVRVGNAADKQLQLDVFGELIETLHLARKSGLRFENTTWNMQKEVLGFLEKSWTFEDEGIWESRGPRRHYTHSKVMAWVAFDRAIKSVEMFGFDGPAGHWRAVREAIFNDVMKNGYSEKRQSFVQEYSSENVDASLLMLPLVGFVRADDPRMLGTIRRIENELLQDGLVCRYRTDETNDGLPGGEGAFLACSFWLVDNYILLGEIDKAIRLFDDLLSKANDVGLLAEEYDTSRNRLVGNFPQAFSHIALLNSAMSIQTRAKSLVDRCV